jgi:hypothetical protein
MTLFPRPGPLAVVALVLGVSASAFAAPPTLTADTATTVPASVRIGEDVVVRMLYRDSDGDRPTVARLVLQPAGGTSTTLPAREESLSSGDPRTGTTLEWVIKVNNPGAYSYHFTLENEAGDRIDRVPSDPQKDFSFVAESLTTKWVIFGVGTLVCLLALPSLCFVLFTSLGRGADRRTAARVGLVLGVLAAALLFAALFWSVYGWMWTAVAAIAALAAVVLLLSSRR